MNARDWNEAIEEHHHSCVHSLMIPALIQLILDAEWEGFSFEFDSDGGGGPGDGCPWCTSTKREGHFKDCRMVAVLAACGVTRS